MIPVPAAVGKNIKSAADASLLSEERNEIFPLIRPVYRAKADEPGFAGGAVIHFTANRGLTKLLMRPGEDYVSVAPTNQEDLDEHFRRSAVSISSRKVQLRNVNR